MADPSWSLTIGIAHGDRNDRLEFGLEPRHRLTAPDLLRLVAISVLAIPFCLVMALAISGQLPPAFAGVPKPLYGRLLIISAAISVVILLAGTLRIQWLRKSGHTLRFLLKANLFEVALLIVVGGLLALFAGHLVADGLACLRGISSAC